MAAEVRRGHPPPDEVAPDMTGKESVGASVTDDTAPYPTPAERAEWLVFERRRRAAARRLPPLACGHRDPLDCDDRCRKVAA